MNIVTMDAGRMTWKKEDGMKIKESPSTYSNDNVVKCDDQLVPLMMTVEWALGIFRTTAQELTYSPIVSLASLIPDESGKMLK